MQCEPDEASSFTNPNVGPGTYASLRLKLGLVPYMGYKGDKSTARPPEGSLVETRYIKGPKSAIVPFAEPRSGPKSRTDSGVPHLCDLAKLVLIKINHYRNKVFNKLFQLESSFFIFSLTFWPIRSLNSLESMSHKVI